MVRLVEAICCGVLVLVGFAVCAWKIPSRYEAMALISLSDAAGSPPQAREIEGVVGVVRARDAALGGGGNIQLDWNDSGLLQILCRSDRQQQAFRRCAELSTYAVRTAPQSLARGHASPAEAPSVERALSLAKFVRAHPNLITAGGTPSPTDLRAWRDQLAGLTRAEPTPAVPSPFSAKLVSTPEGAHQMESSRSNVLAFGFVSALMVALTLRLAGGRPSFARQAELTPPVEEVSKGQSNSDRPPAPAPPPAEMPHAQPVSEPPPRPVPTPVPPGPPPVTPAVEARRSLSPPTVEVSGAPPPPAGEARRSLSPAPTIDVLAATALARPRSDPPGNAHAIHPTPMASIEAAKPAGPTDKRSDPPARSPTPAPGAATRRSSSTLGAITTTDLRSSSAPPAAARPRTTQVFGSPAQRPAVERAPSSIPPPDAGGDPTGTGRYSFFTTPPPHGGIPVKPHDAEPDWAPDPRLDPGPCRGLARELFAFGVEHCFTVAVTCVPGVEDSKSELAASLALALGSTGHARVLLVEADFDRPTLHTLMRATMPAGTGFCRQLQSRLMGHSDEYWSVLRCTKSLHLLVDGPDHTPGLILSRSFETCIRGLRAYYDFIVLDGPPGSRDAECRALDGVADGLIVTSTGARRSEVAQTSKLFTAKRFSKAIGVGGQVGT